METQGPFGTPNGAPKGPFFQNGSVWGGQGTQEGRGELFWSPEGTLGGEWGAQRGPVEAQGGPGRPPKELPIRLGDLFGDPFGSPGALWKIMVLLYKWVHLG